MKRYLSFFLLLCFLNGFSQEKRKTYSTYSLCQGEYDKDKCIYTKLQQKILAFYDSKAIDIIFKEATRDTITINTSLAVNVDGNIDLMNSNISSYDNYIDEINTKILQHLDSFIVTKDNSGNPLSELVFTRLFFTLDHTNGLQNISPLPYGGDYATENVGFAIIENVPIFPGCELQAKNKHRKCFNEQIIAHIRRNFRYPKKAQRKKISGRVNVMFIIDKKGKITKIRTFGADQLLMTEARRIISLLPRMTPGKQREKLVRVPFSIPITFRLQ